MTIEPANDADVEAIRAELERPGNAPVFYRDDMAGMYARLERAEKDRDDLGAECDILIAGFSEINKQLVATEARCAELERDAETPE